ncbi:RICIN domain-containing protein [Actinoplanes subtropicus]|uniref:RICIN domain-containing protein n=1 Tax=Actinoplanes subtropicus TaxID=543632 RepID=UPI0004C3FE42|nr:RICIN domain-containing protein [Actinoplanes subtropicus]
MRLLIAAAAATLGLGLIGVPAAAPAVSADTSAAAGTPAVTITIDPSYRQPEFQGWGTSLAWMAEATGGYPDAIRKKLVDMVFGADGLDLNIARYNIGGGNAPTVRDYLRPGGAVPGYWNAPESHGPADKDWWNPDDPADWNWSADANQRWWVQQIKNRVTGWEAFSNSPPYFQTVSGYVSGGFNASDDQIRADRVDQYADYLVRVTDHLEKQYGIKFAGLEPLNEPNTPYWKTTLGADGQPTGGRQEGAHAGPALQAQVTQAVQRRLATASTRAIVSSPDETNPSTLVTDWYGYPAAGQAAVDRINVHTYGTSQRTSVRDIAKAEQKPLWMSEIEGSWGHDYTSMDSGLGMAQQMIDDIRELEPSAWVLWQPIEDAKNMVAEGNLQWGEIHVPFDCTATDTLQTCPIQTNTKYDTIRNFTHYIRPGDRMVQVSDAHSLAAIAKNGHAVTVVHANATSAPQAVTVDLSKFAALGPSATVTPVVTSADGKLVTGTPVRVSDHRAALTVPAQSVTTFLVRGLLSTAAAAPQFQSGHTYRLAGVQSGRSLAADATIRTTDVASAGQLWTFRRLAGGDGNRARYEVTNAGTGQRLAVRNGKLGPEPAGAADEAAEWVLSTTGDGTYTLINVAARQLIDVPGQAVADGTAVGVYQPTSGPNQRWRLSDDTVAGIDTTIAYTVPGRVPDLPGTVTGTTAGGERRTLPVTWQLPPAGRWRTAGTVRVTGTAVDVAGRGQRAVAQVTVDTFTSTEPGRAKTYPGGTPALPATVVGVGRQGGRADLPVVWDPAPVFDQLGVATLTGTATVVDGTKLPATVRVQVAPPGEADVATDAGVTVAASFTESGYSAAGLVNGDTMDKAWSNWKPSGRNASDTLTVTLPQAHDVSHLVVHFYRDSSSGGGLAASVQAGVPGESGGCVAAGPVVPVGTASPLAVDVPVTASGARSVCLVLTAVPNGYLTVAELQVFAKVPGVSSDARLDGIQVGGVPIAGFDPSVMTYRVKVSHHGPVTVTGTATDPYATVVVRRAGGCWEITTTSEDGAHTMVYRVVTH